NSACRSPGGRTHAEGRVGERGEPVTAASKRLAARKDDVSVSRRAVLRGTGALIISFALPPLASARQAGGLEPVGAAARLPGSLGRAPFLDAWIRIDADGTVTAFTGKAELGQGVKTALTQVVSEELEVPLDRLKLVTADTERTPNEGYTAGSHSLQDSGTALRHAAAQAREILILEAARMLRIVTIVRDGNFLAVVAEREFQAIQAMRSLAAAARWQERPTLPKQSELSAALLKLPAEDYTIFEKRAGVTAPATSLAATYSRPYLAHASI